MQEVSTTEPMTTHDCDESQSTSEEIRDARWKDMVEAAGYGLDPPITQTTTPLRERSRSRDDDMHSSRLHGDSLDQHDDPDEGEEAHEDREYQEHGGLLDGPASRWSDGWWSNLLPEDTDLPSAQQLPIHVLMVEGEHQVGFVWAHPRVRVGPILQELGDNLMMPMLISVTPSQAIYWDEVARLEVYEKRRSSVEVQWTFAHQYGNYIR